jgi:hypothetical protein
MTTRPPPKRALLTEATQITEYFVNDPDLNNIAKGIGLLLCPSKDERSFRPDTLGARAHEIYGPPPAPSCRDQCIDLFLRSCWKQPCFYTAVRDVAWPRTAFLIGENKVVTARHSLPIGLEPDALDDVRIIFGLTCDKLRGLTEDPNARIDLDDPKLWTIAKMKSGSYEGSPSERYDFATFEIEVPPGREPLKAPNAFHGGWLSEQVALKTPRELAMLGHPLGLPMTLVRNTSTLTKVLPPGPTSPGLPEGMLLAAMDSIDGYSGAPVLTKETGKWQIVGLCVGTAHNEKAADPRVRACGLSNGDVVDKNGKGRNMILPAEFFFFKP